MILENGTSVFVYKNLISKDFFCVQSSMEINLLCLGENPSDWLQHGPNEFFCLLDKKTRIIVTFIIRLGLSFYNEFKVLLNLLIS